MLMFQSFKLHYTEQVYFYLSLAMNDKKKFNAFIRSFKFYIVKLASTFIYSSEEKKKKSSTIIYD